LFAVDCANVALYAVSQHLLFRQIYHVWTMSILMFHNSLTAVITLYLKPYLLISHTHCVADIDYSTASESTRNARKVSLVTGSNKTQKIIIYCTTYECLQKPSMKMEAEYFRTQNLNKLNQHDVLATETNNYQKQSHS